MPLPLGYEEEVTQLHAYETPVYLRLRDAARVTGRIVSSRGGTRSGKTYAALRLLYNLALADEIPTITSVVSETFPHLKRGAIRDFRDVLGDEFDETRWSRSDSTYTCPSGSIIEFFSADAPGKVHGPARDRLFLNEVQSISYETARQLFVRTRGLILMDYNPVASFWANELVETRPNCVTIHSTYKDNPFLTQEQVDEIEANKGDTNWWKVYGEGEIGTLEGLIYSFELIDEMPDPQGLVEVQGMDFGFTNDPTARVRILADTGRKWAYVDQRCYRKRMLNRDIIDDLRADGVSPYVEIVADCAEPKSIAEIADAGFRIVPCDKDAPVRSEKRVFQIQWVQGWRLLVTKDSVDLIRELRSYTWAKDRDGKDLNVPIDGWDHALDALRYALYTKFGRRAGEGIYNISISRPHGYH